jgi:hypothetical protein
MLRLAALSDRAGDGTTCDQSGRIQRDFRKSPVKREKVAGLQRNTRVVLANHDEP